MKIDPVKSTGRVSLAPMLPELVSSEYVGWLNDEEVVRYTEINGVQDIASTQEYVRTAVASADAALWRIMLLDGEHVGNIRLSNINKTHRRAVVAILIGNRRCWGQGVGTAAIELVSEYGFEELGLNKLSAGIVAPNIGSRIAFERAGYHLEATFRGHVWFDGQFHDNFVMAKFNPAAR